jgi:hypothetical protein
MSWFKVKAGRLRFRGRITRQPFDDWIASSEGAAAVDAAAHRIRFSLFERTGVARRRICRELRRAFETEGVRSALAAEPDRYLSAWTELAHAPSLPRVDVALQRLVVVPRTMILARALPAVTARLASRPAFADLDDPVKRFFSHRVLSEMENAIARAEPSPGDPIVTAGSWVCVAHDRELIWIDPVFSGEEWLGYVMLFEMPARGLQRRERRELNAAVEQLKSDLPSMSQYQRNGVIQTAAAQMRAG